MQTFRLCPTSFVRVFDSERSQKLRPDHLARLVLADFEGYGDIEVDANCWVLLDDNAAFQVQKAGVQRFACQRNALIWLEEFEPARVVIRTDSPSELKGQLSQSQALGCGWVLARNQDPTIDGVVQRASRVWVPFFQSATNIDEVAHDKKTKIETQTILSFDEAETLKHSQWQVKNQTEISTLESTFEGGTAKKSALISHLNTANFLVHLNPKNHGIRIRKTYDCFHGRQRARVFVDGEFVGWWYEPHESRIHRWAVSDFGIKGQWTNSKESIVISIDPPPASPLWSVSEYQVLQFLEHESD